MHININNIDFDSQLTFAETLEVLRKIGVPCRSAGVENIFVSVYDPESGINLLDRVSISDYYAPTAFFGPLKVYNVEYTETALWFILLNPDYRDECDTSEDN